MDWTLTHRMIGAALCLSLTSCCSVCELALRTTRQEPSRFSWKRDQNRSMDVYRQWAERALMDESRHCRELSKVADYRSGFRDGFVAFVDAGGTGEPPPVPPREFWNVDLRSPAGRARANAWFDGYRHGASVARDGGYRDLVSLQSSLLGYGADAASIDAGAHLPFDDESSFPGRRPEALPPPDDSSNGPYREPAEAAPDDRELINQLERSEPSVPLLDPGESELNWQEQPPDTPPAEPTTSRRGPGPKTAKWHPGVRKVQNDMFQQ